MSGFNPLLIQKTVNTKWLVWLAHSHLVSIGGVLFSSDRTPFGTKKLELLLCPTLSKGSHPQRTMTPVTTTVDVFSFNPSKGSHPQRTIYFVLLRREPQWFQPLEREPSPEDSDANGPNSGAICVSTPRKGAIPRGLAPMPTAPGYTTGFNPSKGSHPQRTLVAKKD